MASAPPSGASQQSDRRKQEAALALLLLVGRRRYDLPALVRQAGIRPRAFRQIKPTEALKADIAAPHFAIANGWAAEADALVAAYERGGVDAVHAQIAASGARVDQIVAEARRAFPKAVSTIERWHRTQWLQRIDAATGLNVAMVTHPADVSEDAKAAVEWNGALADDLHQQAKHRIATALMLGLAVKAPASDVKAKIAEAVTQAKRRAAGIGSDQVEKLSRALDRTRREAAGLTKYVWHHTPQRHPRDWHLARDGQVFGPDDVESNDRAGIPPFCKCWEQPLFS